MRWAPQQEIIYYQNCTWHDTINAAVQGRLLKFEDLTNNETENTFVINKTVNTENLQNLPISEMKFV